MKALVVRKFGAPDTLKVEEWSVPAPGAGEVLVDVHAAGINFPDLLGNRRQVSVSAAAAFRARQGMRRGRQLGRARE
jgi:NADPH2:quinone reductase